MTGFVDGDYEETLEKLVRILARHNIQYAITGGYLSIFYGDPRSTQDVDIVVAISQNQLTTLLPALSEFFLVSEEMARQAVDQGKLFQALDLETSIKADLHVVKDEIFLFNRAVELHTLRGAAIRALSKEDAIVAKLRWIKRGSSRSRRDVKGMLLNSVPYDRKLVLSLSQKFGVDELFLELEAEEPSREVE